MKFGLHYLLSCSENQSPVQRYRDTLEQVARAEALGFESAWPVEQHFNQAQSALPCPALMLAAMAERTRTLRLGTAIVQLPLAHPLRIAEEIATLDVLSRGRVELGVGRGSNPKHFAGFGVPFAESRDRFVESLSYIRKAFAEEKFSFEGRFYQADGICLVPRPIQNPHPPIRIAANSADTFEFAGRSGYPILIASHINPFPKLKEFLSLYHNARKAAGHPEAKGDDVTLLMPFYVGQDRTQIREDVGPTVSTYVNLLSSVITSALAGKLPDAERKHIEAILEKTRQTTYDDVNAIMGIFDTPEACVERLKRVEQEFNPGRVITWFNFVGAIHHDKVMKSMELFSSKVLPHF